MLFSKIYRRGRGLLWGMNVVVYTCWHMMKFQKNYYLLCHIRSLLFFGIGITVGEAVVGNIGSDQLHNYTAIGDCVNYSCRLSDIAGPGQILISAEAYERVKDRIEVEFIGDVQVKGRHAGEVYQVLRLKEAC